MARSFDALFPQVTDFGNLYEAWRKAAKGKRLTPAAAGFEMNLSDELIRLQRELVPNAATRAVTTRRTLP